MTEAAEVRRHNAVNSPPERNRSLRAGRIVVDWSDVFTRIGEDIDPLLEWVKTYPHTSDIHVFLGPVRRKPVRLLRNCLQSLGCKVTLRSLSSSKAVPFPDSLLSFGHSGQASRVPMPS